MEDNYNPLPGHVWTDDWILWTHTHIYHINLSRPSSDALATRVGKMLVLSSWEKGLRPQITYLDCRIKLVFSQLPSWFCSDNHDCSNPCWRVSDVGKKHLHWASTFPPNWGVLLRFLPHSLWLLQTVVTGCNLLTARYVDRCEGGRLYWSQLPGLANHYTSGQA